MSTAQHVLQTGKATTYLHVQARASKRGPGQVRKGHHVSVVAGESVRVFGSDQRYVRNEETGRTEIATVKYDVTFRVGDVAVYGGFNLTYTGRITAIGPKTVTIEDRDLGKVRRLDLHAFSGWNAFFNLETIERRNSEWLD